MTKLEAAKLLNEDLRNEYKHMLFYLHSANILMGMDRLYLADKLSEHAKSEMEHVQQFAHKIRALGLRPVSGLLSNTFPEFDTAANILAYALEMEQEVVRNYHERHKQLQETGDVSLVVFIEDQIQDSQEDIDELLQILNKV